MIMAFAQVCGDEMDIKDEIETDDLTDEALDHEQRASLFCKAGICGIG